MDDDLIGECRATFGDEAADQLAAKLASFGDDIPAKVAWLRASADEQMAHAKALRSFAAERRRVG